MKTHWTLIALIAAVGAFMAAAAWSQQARPEQATMPTRAPFHPPRPTTCRPYQALPERTQSLTRPSPALPVSVDFLTGRIDVFKPLFKSRSDHWPLARSR